MSFDQDAVDAAAELMRPRFEAIEASLGEIQRRIKALEDRPDGSALFAARDNFETALFSAMRDMTDAEQVEFFNRQAERISAAS